MSLNKLCLFKNVKITPDYSVVHDMDIETWKNYLLGWLDPMPADSDTPELVLSQTVNYYRMPEVIRVEGNYDAIRKATYGFLEDGGHEGNETLRTSFKVLFFWVKDVRLLKQASNIDRTDPSDPLWKDVCELDVELDVWSTYAGCFELFDSYIERRHMPRWENTGTELSPVWVPIYYPNAAQGIEGAMEMEQREDVTPGIVREHVSNVPIDMEWYLVSILDKDGVCNVYMGARGVVKDESGTITNVYPIYSYDGSKRMFAYSDILSGSIYATTEMNTSAEFVQSITVLPSMGDYWNDEIIEREISGTWKLCWNMMAFTGQGTNLFWGVFRVPGMSVINFLDSYDTVSVQVIGPDHSHIDGDGTLYDEKHEPMMYHEPARVRKVTTAFGGEVFTIPEIACFDDNISWINMFDLNSISTFIYAGNDLVRANALGALGVGEAPTLPIFSSAWKSYDAISKVSDTMMFNAKQLQTVGTGLGGSALSAAGGFMMGGPAGAVLGLASGILGTVSGVYGNDVELDAKRVQIKNSPCNVKSGGSGLGATMVHNVDFFYITLKIDEQSMEKLRYMYYWFGYHVNRTFKGIIDLETREVFDFIKTSGAKVKGDISAGEAKQLAAIFDKGVTIYHGKDGYAKIGDGTMWNNDEV